MLDRTHPAAGAASRVAIALRRGRWPLTGALLLALLAGSWALAGLIEGAAWWWLLIGFGALLLVAPAVLRTLGVPRLIAALLDLVLYCLVIDAAYGRPALGVAPTGPGLRQLATIAANGWDAVERTQVPAPPLPELLFLVVGIGGLAAVLLDLAGMTAPLLVGVILLAIIAVPAAITPDGVGLPAVAACAAAFLVVLAADGRVRFGTRGTWIATTVIAGSTLVALAATALTPGLQPSWWTLVHGGPGGGVRGASSLIDLGDDLRTASNAEVLRYTTDRAVPPYLQLAALDDYNGTTWTHHDVDRQPIDDGAVRTPRIPGLSADGVPSSDYAVDIQVEGLSADWAPAPYPMQGVAGGPATWSFDPDDLSLSIGRNDRLGSLSYRVQSVDLKPTETQLAAATPDASSAAILDGACPDCLISPGGPAAPWDPDDRSGTPSDPGIGTGTFLGDDGDVDAGDGAVALADDLALPTDLPPIITATAQRVAGSQTTEIGMARALQDYFRGSGGFSYSTSTPDAASDDGMTVIANFLQRKSGYCIHFAAAMTVMARTLGIPARIAIGYLPGTRRADADGTAYYSVSNQHLHAWPQLYFSGIGWLDFEPTVGLGTSPAYASAPGATAVPTDTPSPTESSTPTRRPTDPATQQARTEQTETDSTAAAGRTAGWAGIAVLVVLLLLAPAGVRALRRRRRLRRLSEGGPPALAWTELLDTARDLGRGADPAETPRAFAARLGTGLPEQARGDLEAVLLAVERATFGPAAGAGAPDGELAARTRRIIEGLERSSAPARRFAARMLPSSLLGSFPRSP